MRFISLAASVVVLVAASTHVVADEASKGRSGEAVSKAAGSATNESFEQTVKPFLKAYCIKCHGTKAPKGDRSFAALTGVISDDNSLVDLQDILDLLNLGEMPPEDERQPTAPERRRVIKWLTDQIGEYHASRENASTTGTLRRLNAREYRRTVRDLFDLNISIFDPTTAFPRDQTSEHLDNVGESLVTSGYLLAKYLEAADSVVERAVFPLQKPKVQQWIFRDGFRQQPEIDQVHRKTNLYEHMTLYDVVGADKPEGAYGPILAFREGVPYDGYYEIRLKAEAVNRINPYDPKFLGVDPSEPLRLGIVAGNYRVGDLHKHQPIEPLLAELDLADKPDWYTVRIWLDRGYTPRFTFRNGLMDVRNLWSRLLREYKDQFPPRKNSGIVEARFNAIKYGKLPQIHIHEIEISGPFYDEWPRASQRLAFGENWKPSGSNEFLSPKEVRTQLAHFISRAYRRPSTDAEIDRILTVIATRREAGRTPVEAYADGLKSVLCSPNFLYLEQPDSEREDSYAIASRLSYFLWSSMPDEELFKLAASQQLTDPDTLEAQAERMLRDPKSAAFINGFLDSWLTLRELGATPPDRSRFRTYYHYGLDEAMRTETVLFTRHLLDENLSVANFLDADFTFVNRNLARHYGLPVPDGPEFTRVPLKDNRRGGLLGQASVLTVTANGIDTSPVVRGVWMLDNILGTPPSPPPPDVEPLDPDVRGAKSIRDQLDKHRKISSCNDCHRKIDPLGFALENFDPIGRWRDNYSRNVRIDASGKLPNGSEFKNIIGLKRILADQQDQFRRALTSKLLAYSTGRHVVPADRPQIDQIVSRNQDKGQGFRDLIKAIVVSDSFRSQ